MKKLALFLFLFAPIAAAAEGTMYVAPRSGTVTIGERFDVRVIADSGENLVSAAEGELTFNPAALEVVNISSQNSILDSWSTPPEFSNTDGYIRFSGWTGTHYEGTSGHILTITFVAKRQMTARLDIQSGALLSETGTSNILTGVQPGVYTIALNAVEHAEPEILGASSAIMETSIAALSEKITVGESIRIVGTTAPNALLSVRLTTPSDSNEFPLASGADGSYSFVSDPVHEAGVYRAKVTALDGSRAEPSEQIAISVSPNTVAAAAGFLGDYGAPIGGGVLATLFVALCIGYMVHRARRA